MSSDWPEEIKVPTLAEAISRLRCGETAALNHLQAHGIISDLVVNLQDVGNDDQRRAADWLLKNQPETR